mmetsp:Transcript_70516/g.153162  ORF Transcript_70516/g.153162 Transcript_70516/m.153162 type:complete len:582 (+) Transcript_70516:93-1838(+)
MSPTVALLVGIVSSLSFTGVCAGSTTSSPASVQQQPRKLRSTVAAEVDPSLQLAAALEGALGAGHGIHEHQMMEIYAKLVPTWKSLPKNPSGKVNKRSVFYVVHRYFMQSYSINIIGLDSVAGNTSFADLLDINRFAPRYVQELLDGENLVDGYAMEDAVAMVVVIEHFISNSGREILDHVYAKRKVEARVSQETLAPVVENFMIRWMLSSSPNVMRTMENEAERRMSTFEEWAAIVGHISGAIQRFEHAGDASGRSGPGKWNPMDRRFSFEDTHAVVDGMVKSFGDFWNPVCSSVKEKLKEMDSGSTGRVSLSKFHKSAFGGEWRFGESTDYLRTLGALDESSAWHGPRVIIPNYLQSASNCIVSTSSYRVCCKNECEDYMDALEAAVGGPLAEPEHLLALVGEFAAENDEGGQLPSSLRSQLMNIAEANNGRVPLHGRLFAQWLHYAFPYECPFPHVVGTVESVTPEEFGTRSLASRAELQINLKSEIPAEAALKNLSLVNGTGDADWMTWWSHEEELLSERLHLTAPWERNVFQILKLALGAALALCSMLGARKRFSESDVKKALPLGLSPEGKSHFV